MNLDELIDHLAIAPNGCFECRATDRAGYGRIYHDGRSQYAHRVIYSTFVGPIPAGLVIDHLCRNRSCVNPDHLEPVASKENTLRGTSPAARYAKATHCIHGHEFTPENTIVRPSGKRNCRTCNNALTRRRRKLKRLKISAAAQPLLALRSGRQRTLAGVPS